jgi:hypothetical protein
MRSHDVSANVRIISWGCNINKPLPDCNKLICFYGFSLVIAIIGVYENGFSGRSYLLLIFLGAAKVLLALKFFWLLKMEVSHRLKALM